MDWNKPGSGGGFAQVKPGTYVGTCYRLIDQGTQRNDYQGKVQYKRDVMIGFELTELMDDGRPLQVTAWVTQSLHEKSTLRKWLIAWRGRDYTPEELDKFDPRKLLGQPAMLTVVLTKGGKSKVEGVSKLVAGMDKPTLVNPTTYFSLEREEFDREIFDSLSDGIKNKIRQSPEFHQCTGEVPPPADQAGQGGQDTDYQAGDGKALADGGDGLEPDDIPF